MDKTPPPDSGDGPEKRETWTYDESAGSAARVETSSLEPGSTFHRYFILDRVGEGGMGVVYAAYDPRLDRRVALKFLARRSVGADDIRDQRLLREAQAMARLAHPNVAVVYEVEVVDGRPFLSMEFVDGVDLSEWLAEKRRSFAEVLEVFRGAGRGLAAAHVARIIHRDFKPGNVVLDRQDRPRVTDFGLSRAALEPGDVEPDAKGEPGATVLSSPSHLSTPITGTGAVLGTFSYMSPEQHAGGVVDARSDQFSFCVALYEAVYGEHPFGGGLERGEKEKAWTVAPAPAGSSVPRWCRQALLRGLAQAPNDRFPSMDALLAALSPHRVSRRWQLAGGIALAIILPAAFAFALSRDSSDGAAAPRCDLGVQRLAGAWDPARKQELRKVFARSGAPGAETTWQAFSEILDQRAGAWAAMHNQACAATHVDGVQSPAVLDLRMECLARRRQEMKDLVDVYTDAPDAKSLDRAVRAADTLPTVSPCANVATLRAVVPLPDDPATLVAVQSVRQRLSRSLALYEAGRYKQGREYMEALKKEADATGYGPLIAEAGQALARHISQVEPEEAEKVLLDAAKQAVKAQDWALEAEIQLSVLANYGRAGRVLESLVAGRFAELAVERARGDDALRGRLAMNMGSAEGNAGHFEEALRHYRQARELWKRSLGTRSHAFVRARQNTGITLLNMGRKREALGEFEAALTLQRTLLRSNHPDVASTLDGLGQGYMDLGQLQEAHDAALAALTIRREELGAEHVLTTYSLEQTANAESRLGNFKRAFELYESVLSTQKRVLDKRDVFLSNTYLSLGEAERRAGHLDRAERSLRAVIEQCARAGVPEHVNVGNALASLGLLHNTSGRFRLALADCRKAFKLISREVGEDSSSLVLTRECLGEALIGTGDAKAARAELERALTPQVEKDTGPQWMAGARLQMARALWASGEQRRGREVARAAAASLATAEGDNRAVIARIEKWLAEHGESSAR